MSAPRVAASPGELLSFLSGVASVDDGRLVIEDEATFRSGGIRDLVWTATFSQHEETVEAARWMVWEASQELGSSSASIHELYMARARGEYVGFTVPAINLRTQVFDMAAAACRAAMELDRTVIFELARSEQEYTFQRPGEYITSVLAGCITAGWRGPVFVQGDHYQFNAAKYRADPEGVTDTLRKATVNALSVGYGNIDIDSSTLVDLSLASLDEQQKVNYTRAAELSALIRESQDEGSRSRSGVRSARSASRTRRRTSSGPTSKGIAGSSMPALVRMPWACPRSASRPAPRTAACRCRAAAWPR
jgi:hypothetical protein